MITVHDSTNIEMKPIGDINCLLIYDLSWRRPSATLCRMSIILCLVLYSNKNIDNESVKSVPTLKKWLEDRADKCIMEKDTLNLLTFRN